MKKKILIIGGSSDIGVELVNIFLKKNFYQLHLHYNTNSKVKKIYNKNCKFIKSDLFTGSEKSILKKFDANYDIIINLVGYINTKSFENFSIKTIDKSLKINSIIPLLIIRKSLKNMIKNKWGRILNSSSVGVKFGGGNKTFEYSLAKHLNEFIPSYLRKIAEKNVFYNVLKIGLTKTKIHKKTPNKNLIKRTKLLPVKKMAKPKDIANYIYFLTSSQNQFITGEVINITGGE